MKALLLAMALAIGSLTASSALAQSAGVIIETGDGGYYHRYHDRDDWGRRDRDDWDDEDNGLHRGWYTGNHYGWRRHHERCWIEVRRSWHHHRMIIERERVCRD